MSGCIQHLHIYFYQLFQFITVLKTFQCCFSVSNPPVWCLIYFRFQDTLKDNHTEAVRQWAFTYTALTSVNILLIFHMRLLSVRKRTKKRCGLRSEKPSEPSLGHVPLSVLVLMCFLSWMVSLLHRLMGSWAPLRSTNYLFNFNLHQVIITLLPYCPLTRKQIVSVWLLCLSLIHTVILFFFISKNDQWLYYHTFIW